MHLLVTMPIKMFSHLPALETQKSAVCPLLLSMPICERVGGGVGVGGYGTVDCGSCTEYALLFVKVLRYP